MNKLSLQLANMGEGNLNSITTFFYHGLITG